MMTLYQTYPISQADRPQADAGAILARRLASHGPLDAAAASAVRSIPWHLTELGNNRSTRAFDQLRDRVLIVLSGVMFHHAIVRSGARQIISVHLPGELVGIDSSAYSATVGAHGPVQVAVFDQAAWRAAITAHAAIREAVTGEVHASLAIVRAWLTNNCRREAATRVAHLLCEVAYRSHDGGVPRLTQEFVSDCVGLTSVHTNRVLRRLEAMGCVRRDGDRYQLLDADRLREFGEFDANYLMTPVPLS